MHLQITRKLGPGRSIPLPRLRSIHEAPRAAEGHLGSGETWALHVSAGGSQPPAQSRVPGSPGPRRPPRRSSFEDLRIPPPLPTPPTPTSGQAAPPSASFLRPAAPPLPTLLLFGAVRSGVFNNSTWEVSPRKCLVINFTQQEVRSSSDVRKPPSH